MAAQKVHRQSFDTSDYPSDDLVPNQSLTVASELLIISSLLKEDNGLISESW